MQDETVAWGPTPVRKVDVLELPAAARTAFARAVHDGRPPLAVVPGRTFWWPIVVGALGLAIVAGWGYASRSSEAMMQAPEWIAGYAASFATVAGGVWWSRRRSQLARLLGCKPGVYVLGTQLVDARSRTLRVFDLAGVEPRVVAARGGAKARGGVVIWHGYEFAHPRLDHAFDALANVEDDSKRIRDATSHEDLRQLYVLDPIGVGVALRWSEDAARPSRSRRFAWSLALAAIGSLGLAVATWRLRNHGSIEAAFDDCRTADQVDAWVAAGGDPARALGKKMAIEQRLAVTAPGERDRADPLRAVLAAYPDAPVELRAPVEAALRQRYHDPDR